MNQLTTSQPASISRLAPTPGSALGYNVQKQATGGIWVTYAYETELKHAERCERALQCVPWDKTRIKSL